MVAVDVGLDQGEVALDHFESGVTEQALQGVRIAAIAEVVDREGVAEAVNVDAGEAGALADLLKQIKQGVTVKGVAKLGDKERGVDFFIFAGSKVLPNGLAGAGAEGQDALLAALAKDDQVTVAHVAVLDARVAELAGANACIEQQQDNGAVAVGVLEAVGTGALAGPGVRAGSAHSVKHEADVGFRVGLDFALFRARRGDAPDDVLLDQVFINCPGP